MAGLDRVGGELDPGCGARRASDRSDRHPAGCKWGNERHRDRDPVNHDHPRRRNALSDGEWHTPTSRCARVRESRTLWSRRRIHTACYCQLADTARKTSAGGASAAGTSASERDRYHAAGNRVRTHRDTADPARKATEGPNTGTAPTQNASTPVAYRSRAAGKARGRPRRQARSRGHHDGSCW